MKKFTSILVFTCATQVGLAQLYISNGFEFSSVNQSVYSNEDIVNEGIITFTESGALIIDAGFDNSATTAQLALGDARLVIGSGTTKANGTNTFIFKNRNAQLLGDEIKHLVLNKATGTANVTGGHLGVSETFESISGSLNAASTVTLLNRTENQYAQVLPSNGGTVHLEVERFIPSKRAFRLLSPSVISSESINSQWQEGATQYTDNPVPGFGTHITGFGSQNPTPVLSNQNGFDWNPSGNASLFPYNSNHQVWTSTGVNNTVTETLSYHTPLRLFVRGDRNTDITSNSATASNTILRTRGALKIGTHTVIGLSNAANHFNFIANPYASRVDFSSPNVIKTNLTDFIYVWDTSLGSMGAFATVDLTNPSAPNPTNSNATSILMPGQAVFVRNTANGNPSLIFNENAKTISAPHASIFNQEAYLNLKLQALSNNEFLTIDGIGFRFSEAHNLEVNDFDAIKLPNPNENLLILKEHAYLSIEKRPIPLEEEVIPLGFVGHNYLNYQFVPEFVLDHAGVKVFLKDNYLNEQHELSSNEALNFEVNPSIPESINAFRFELVFSPIDLSTEDFEEIKFSVYPNPASTKATIELPNTQNLEAWNLEIYSITGKKLQAESIAQNQQTHTISLNSMSSGVYLVKVFNNQYSSTLKLIKK